MKQPDSIDVGTQMDVVRHRLNVAREDLETAHLTFEAEQYRGANNRAYYSIFHTICAVLAKEGVAFKRHKDEYSNAIVHAFQRFRAPFSGKIVHIFPEQNAAFN